MNLFGFKEEKTTYRAIRHKIVRQKQKNNDISINHPIEKINQIKTNLSKNMNYKILELFSGQGTLTKVYQEYGVVDSFDKTTLDTGDSYLIFHKLISEKKKYDVIDVDPYGFPNRFFPDIFLLMDETKFFLTFPKPYVNILNGITQTHLYSYFQKTNPSKDEILERIALFGLCHWKKVELIDSFETRSNWRFVFNVSKVLATSYTGTNNRKVEI